MRHVEGRPHGCVMNDTRGQMGGGETSFSFFFNWPFIFGAHLDKNYYAFEVNDGGKYCCWFKVSEFECEDS